MGAAGAQTHPPGGVQQVEQRPLEGEGQVPVAGAEAEGEEAAGELPLEFPLDLVAHLLHGGGGAAVQGQGPEHVSALRPSDEGVHLGGQGGAEQGRPAATPQVPLQVLPGQEKAAVQAHPLLLGDQVKHPVRPPGPGGGDHLPGALFHQRPQVRPRLVRGRAHVAQDLVGVDRCKGNGQI